jgi:hypothetical protein
MKNPIPLPKDPVQDLGELSFFMRAVYVWAVVGGGVALVCQLSRREIIEFSSEQLTVCKDIWLGTHKRISDPRMQWTRMGTRRRTSTDGIEVQDRLEDDPFW